MPIVLVMTLSADAFFHRISFTASKYLNIISYISSSLFSIYKFLNTEVSRLPLLSIFPKSERVPVPDHKERFMARKSLSF